MSTTLQGVPGSFYVTLSRVLFTWCQFCYGGWIFSSTAIHHISWSFILSVIGPSILRSAFPYFVPGLFPGLLSSVTSYTLSDWYFFIQLSSCICITWPNQCSLLYCTMHLIHLMPKKYILTFWILFSCLHHQNWNTNKAVTAAGNFFLAVGIFLHNFLKPFSQLISWRFSSNVCVYI